MLKLVDLIRLSGVTLNRWKIHCATGKKNPPLDAFLNGTWKAWQEEQTKENFKCKQIVSLIHLSKDRWLFAGVYDVLGVTQGSRHRPEWFTYSTREVPRLDGLTGRAIVRFDKGFRASYLRGSKWADNMQVVAINEQRMTVGEFPGFNAVLLPLATLRTVVGQEIESWKAALGNVAGVYVITDNSDGRHYVGSAYGGEGLWSRWASYAKTGHGGNKELKALLAEKGSDHASHFQFSILEVCDLNASDEFILSREVHWKKVLRTRDFGLNGN
jgi:hypothetical protein